MTDKKQTAMQKMIERINSLTRNGHDDAGLKTCKQIAIELLELEREQILEAFVAGDERGTKEIPFNCEQYYNQTFIS